MFKLENRFWSSNSDRAELARAFLEFKESVNPTDEQIDGVAIASLCDCIVNAVPFESSAAIFPHVLDLANSQPSSSFQFELLAYLVDWSGTHKWKDLSDDSIGYDKTKFFKRFRTSLTGLLEGVELEMQRCVILRGIALTFSHFDLAQTIETFERELK